MSKNNTERKRRYRSDGSSIWGKRSIDGPGVWVSCVKGKEKQTVGELYDLFEQLASELYPELGTGNAGAGNEEETATNSDQEEEEDLEKQLAKELAAMKKPRKQQIFANCQTNTTLVFISCKPPVDPVRLVLRHIENVEKTGVTNTRFTQRLTPITNSCVANVPEITSLFKRVLKSFLEEDPERIKSSYKIELRSRNHNTLTRQQFIDTIAVCVPPEFTVDLENPKIFILVEVFKSVCGISIVEDYYKHTKFNVMEIANAKNEVEKFKEGEGRVLD
ncbi:uncharacterized protein STEHIDRAFT_90713 [Stereum hirsutum FP-91666 SS1]|uniref:uncharacterized protein n=1 Tax=Stereum hirsutum (strain FP-91666) TaxID=721885 RepID=UPI000440C145|nr:uncharacterized protein STEHIDRAFT_90713 [Stereum hirsutum FP-91666 SS1]EIM90842.1 hypothetical protein STEHIDRAFT_90713 [Stereum hirsutum FP-91666 SS1]